MKTKLSIISLLCLALNNGQEAQAQSTTMRTVNVRASHRLADTGVQKTVIDSTALHDNISLSMADVLDRSTSVFIKSYGRATESTAEFRGTSPCHTQVLWNGLNINSPMLGSFDFSTIPSFFVDDVNLYHGASSLNVTGGGLGGAVDMKSRPITEDGVGLQYIQGFGSYKTFDQFLRFNYSNGYWSTSTRVGYAKSDNDFTYTNHDKKTDVKDENGNILYSYHPKEKNKSGYFDGLHVLQDLHYNDRHGNHVGLSAWYTLTTRGLPFLSVDYKDDTDFTNEQKFNTLRSSLSYEHLNDNWTAGIRAGYSYQDVGYDYSTTRQGITSNITKSRSYTNSAQTKAYAKWMPTENWTVEGNAEVCYNHVRSYDRSPYHTGENYKKGRWEGNVSLCTRWRPLRDFSLSAIIREETYPENVLSPIPAFFAEYTIFRPWDVTLKASVTRNYRYPSMNDMYFKPGGNPDLKPEKGFTYDGGMQFHRYNRKIDVSGSVSAFDSYIDNWIQWLPNQKGFWQPDNVKRVHSYGTECSLRIKLRLNHELTINVNGNYAYTASINKGDKTNDNDTSYGKQLCYIPLHSANVSPELSWKSWTLTYKWNFYSERYTTTSNESEYITGVLKPYFMSDISLSKSFTWQWIYISVKAAVNNLLGSEYVTVLSHHIAPRNFGIYIELKPLFKKKDRT